METVLLIDGKNTAYRAVFAARGNPEFRQKKYHPFTVWLTFTHVWLQKFKPDAVHVFWDCPKDDIWRKRVLSEYKNNRDKMACHTSDVQEDITRLIDAATAIIPYMGVRQYIRMTQESDDLIFAAAKLLTPPNREHRRVVVISSDSDFLQLPWTMPHVEVYLPKEAMIAEHPSCSPTIAKALIGDTADNVDGFRGIGPVHGAKMASDPTKLIEFLDATPGAEQKFKRNLALIDLSMNPAVVSNMIYMLREMAKPTVFDGQEANKLAIQHKVIGFMSEWTRVALAFKRLK